MPSAASQVEVQAPPGLEKMGPDPSGGASSSAASDKQPAEQEMKEELIRQVTAAVKEDVEKKTAAAVENLWQKGQKAIQYMQVQHQAKTEQLQGQLAACAESYRNLERENAMLRGSLEAVMKHLTVLYGAPPLMPQSPHDGPHGASIAAAAAHAAAAGNSPFFPPPPATAPPQAPGLLQDLGSDAAQRCETAPHPQAVASSSSSSVQTSAEASAEKDSSDARVKEDKEEDDDEEQLVSAPEPTTPRESRSQSPTLPTGDAQSSTDVTQEAATPAGTGFEPAIVARPVLGGQAAAAPTDTATTPQFSMTLRRADNVPVGLDVKGEDTCLLVERVRAGGAVEAWNRQCPGALREIKPGDRIIMINDVEDPEGMRQECLTKHLLRMTVVRGTGIVQPRANLRADADEFVPGAAF
eukprot:TRINITY_DN3247_c0_g1_i1.p1 TRINITY_DN3247_c0_g1~~TRINITY_DN3247_c0_g1_i1.p1  ORF type:complete len:411 (-),score=95.47 TRINITY_DN3247_c0_g1_i1:81-1313(-)